MEARPIKTHHFVFNDDDNGGESLSLTTHFMANGDEVTDKEGVYLNQELTLKSYSNSASFNLCGVNITPTKLRELANQLEIERNKLIITKS